MILLQFLFSSRSRAIRLLLPALLLLAPGASWAQTDSGIPHTKAEAAARRVRLPADDARDFYRAFKSLSDQARVVFVAEGAPLIPTLAAGKAPHFAEPTPLLEVVTKLAAAFDYKIVDRQFNVFALQKRYSDPRDLPAVTPEECVASLQEILRLSEPYNPNIKIARGQSLGKPLIGDLLESLTPEQRQALQNQRLRVQELSPPQKSLVRRTALYFWLQTGLGDVHAALHPLRQMDEAALRLHERHGLGYEGRNTDGRTTFVSLSFMNLARVGAAAEPDTGQEKEENGVADLSSPSQTQEPGRMTLGNVAALLNAVSESAPARAAADENGEPTRLTVEETLSAKPVVFIGRKYATMPARILKACAQAYGLENGLRGPALLLRRKRVIPIQDVQYLPYLISQALPDTLLRAIHDNPPVRDAVPMNLTPTSTKEEYQREDAARMIRHALLQKAENGKRRVPATLRAEAVRVLEAVVKKRLETVPDPAAAGSVPLRDLSDEERGVFAVAIMSRFLERMQLTGFNKIVPEYIGRFEELYLTGGLKTEGGKQTMDLLFSVKRAGGNLDTIGGAGGFEYKPR